MKKIPTLFRRDPDNMARVLPEVHPDCQWVIDGKGKATRKYDGTCVALFPVVQREVRIHGGIGSNEINEPDDLTAIWLARREVKPGKAEPVGFIAEETDPETGKTVGWEPMESSPFVRAWRDAIGNTNPVEDWYFGTYELCGPKVQGNPEGYERHTLVRHRDAEVLDEPPRDFDSLMAWLLKQDGVVEGVVWHCADSRMAKLKVRDAKMTLQTN